MEGLKVFVIGAIATVVEDFGGVEAFLNIGFANIKDDDGFDFVTGARGDRHNLVFFTLPAADGREN